MGIFDEVRIDGSLYQTKALGRGMTLYSLGDEVRLVRAPFSHGDFMARDLGEWDFSPEGNPTTYQFQALDGESPGNYRYILVVEGKISTLLLTPRENVPAYDYHGHILR